MKQYQFVILIGVVTFLSYLCLDIFIAKENKDCNAKGGNVIIQNNSDRVCAKVEIIK